MRKLATLFISATLILSAITAANAVEITGGQKEVGSRDVASNGTVSAVTWGKRISDDSSKIWVSYKRGGTAWTTKQSLGTIEWSPFATPQVTVRPDGSIFVAWLDDDQVDYRELAADSTTWSDLTLLTDSSVSGQWFNDLDVTSSGDSVTIAGVRSLQDSLKYVSWTRLDNQSSWNYSEIANAMNSGVFGSCSKAKPEACNYSVFDIRIASNENGNQVMSWLTYRETNGWKAEMKGSTFAIFTARRSSPSESWSAAQKIDAITFKAKVQYYAYFVGTLLITPQGKSAISWMTGYNSTPISVHVSVSNNIGTAFSEVEKTQLSKGGESNQINLTNIGENIWCEYYYYPTVGADAKIRVGKIGDMANAKLSNFADQYTIDGFTNDGSSPVILASLDDGAKANTLFAFTKTANGWKDRVEVLTLASGNGDVASIDFVVVGGVNVVAAVGATANKWDLGIELGSI